MRTVVCGWRRPDTRLRGLSRGCSGIMTPGARCRARADQEKRHRRQGQNSGAEKTMATLQRRPCRSALRAYGWRGTARAQEDRRRIDQGLPGAFRRKGTPRVRLRALTESRGGKEARRRSPASVACTCPPPVPRREVSPGRPSARRMYPSPTESLEDEYDSYLRRSRGRKTEGRSCSPRPRRPDERHSQEEWERRREDSPRDREPPGPLRAIPPRPSRPRSSSREKAYTDSQRDVNEGTINILRSMHAKLMTLQGQTGKNSGYPYFDGTLKEYPKFRRRWPTFQDLYHKATPQRELVNLFRENCLEKKVADRLRCKETMAGCWRVLDPFYSRPTQYAQDLIVETLLTQANIALMEHPLPTREIEEWRSRQARYAPRYHADAFVEFVDNREE